MSSHRAQASRGGRDHRRKRESASRFPVDSRMRWKTAAFLDECWGTHQRVFTAALGQGRHAWYPPLKGARVREAELPESLLSLESALPKAFVSESLLLQKGTSQPSCHFSATLCSGLQMTPSLPVFLPTPCPKWVWGLHLSESIREPEHIAHVFPDRGELPGVVLSLRSVRPVRR